MVRPDPVLTLHLRLSGLMGAAVGLTAAGVGGCLWWLYQVEAGPLPVGVGDLRTIGGLLVAAWTIFAVGGCCYLVAWKLRADALGL